ncbi:MAG: type VI secretion system ATPase TssH, partial [Planctomycetes bacterium]|nr:type VI secretion system ATPase TssH [Planctomycetota bacterium]
RAPALSPEIQDWMREAWVVTSLNLNAYRIRSGYLLTALLTDRNLASRIRGSSQELAKISGDQLLKEVATLIAGSSEDQEAGEPVGAAPTATGGAPGPVAGSKTPSLDQFTLNLTERAKKGEIDPVIGRDAEIRQVIDILTRRRQNNPILTGEAGVGKTAVVEGFALRIVAGDVPESLKNVALRTLDLGLLQAGAGVKGEFENRLKGVIAEVKASTQPIILFIDEAHTLIGAGGAAGSGDAANLLKPALARGELRTVAATTWAEYKKFFETDAALKRRFQVVKVDEPDITRGIRMMRGFAPTLEKHHQVRILEEAVDDAVKLSVRYLTDRQLPDKSVSLLDTASAKVALGQSSTPPALEDCRREIEHLNIELGILERETAVGVDHAARLQELTEQKQAAEKRLADLEKRWTEEKRLVADIQRCRARLEGPMAGKDKQGKEQPKLSAMEESQVREDLGKLQKELAKIQGDSPLVQPVVDSQAVAGVVSSWTGIPVGKMVLDEIKTVLTLREKLEERIIGQSHALEAIAQRIRTARANLVDPRRPFGVFLMVGPSGVGKTETAMALADILYGGDRNMVVINMSEYKEDHKISRLTGSAPGYVGYGEGGVLTEAVRRKPYSIVLLDEVEKANVGVQEVFYQVFDKGTLQDDKGQEINFKNTIIILTSNVGTDTIMKVCADPDTRPDSVGLAEALRPDLLKSFKPALLGRMTIVPYFPLTDEVIRQIIKLQMGRIGERMRQNHKAVFTYDDAVVGAIASRCKEVESGARNVDQILTGTLLPEISREFLARMAEGQPVQKAHVSVDGDSKFVYQLS